MKVQTEQERKNMKISSQEKNLYLSNCYTGAYVKKKMWNIMEKLWGNLISGFPDYVSLNHSCLNTTCYIWINLQFVNCGDYVFLKKSLCYLVSPSNLGKAKQRLQIDKKIPLFQLINIAFQNQKCYL